MIYWRSGSPWDVANLYLSQRIELVLGDELTFATVKREADHLCAFASFLEVSGLEWYAFGNERDKKPTYAFRGSLLKARRAKTLAPSTVAARMGVVIRFYKWVLSQGLIDDGTAPFERRDHVVRVIDKVGFAQSMVVASTNLAIRNKQRGRGVRLEGGLRPVSIDTRNAILDLARTVSSPRIRTAACHRLPDRGAPSDNPEPEAANIAAGAAGRKPKCPVPFSRTWRESTGRHEVRDHRSNTYTDPFARGAAYICSVGTPLDPGGKSSCGCPGSTVPKSFRSTL